jgi:hypothetical protein
VQISTVIELSIVIHLVLEIYSIIIALKCISVKIPPTVATFSSVVVSDSIFAVNWNSNVNPPGTPNRCQRVANLCDFVPALRSLLPPTAALPDCLHVGEPILFASE